MPRKVSLPSDYVPYQTLIVCGNTLINGKVPLEVNGYIPFLVGVGPSGPLVWLQLPRGKQLDFWQYVVRANRSLHKAVKVKESANEVHAYIRSTLVLLVVAEVPESARIEHLDLRPMGLRIHGTTKELQVGEKTMRDNVFENVDAMLGIGVEDPRHPLREPDAR
jgi:hypothetical protein